MKAYAKRSAGGNLSKSPNESEIDEADEEEQEEEEED